MIRVRIVLAGALLAMAGSAAAQLTQEQAESVVETRQALLRVIGWTFSPMGAMARDRIEFDAERVQTNAGRLQTLIPMLSDAFAPDTRGADVTTEALDGIWEEPERFASKIEASIEASNALVAAAGTGDEGAMRAAITDMGSTCGSCHDDYRADD